MSHDCQYERESEEIVCTNCGHRRTWTREAMPNRICQPIQWWQLAPTIASGALSCVHRGEELREEKCELCSEKGTLRKVHACALHGKCAIRKWKSGSVAGVKFCNVCDDLKPPVSEPLKQFVCLWPGSLPPEVQSAHGWYILDGNMATELAATDPQSCGCYIDLQKSEPYDSLWLSLAINDGVRELVAEFFPRDGESPLPLRWRRTLQAGDKLPLELPADPTTAACGPITIEAAP